MRHKFDELPNGITEEPTGRETDVRWTDSAHVMGLTHSPVHWVLEQRGRSLK